MSVVEYEKQDYEKLKRKDKLVVLDFYTSWCKPCRKIYPLVEDLADKYSQKIKFYHVDGEGEGKSLDSKYKIESYPTFIALLNGEVVDSQYGANEDKLKDWVKKIVKEYL